MSVLSWLKSRLCEPSSFVTCFVRKCHCLPVSLCGPFLLQVHTCLTSACRCLNWTHCSRCLRCCSAARSSSCCFSWRNSSRSWTRVAMSTSLSHNSSTPAHNGHFITLQLTIYLFIISVYVLFFLIIPSLITYCY